MSEELVWIFDAVSGFLKGPEWGVPVWGFIDDNCIVFDSEDENKLAYIDIFNAFREMVENLLEMHLEEFGVTMDQFVTLCTEHSSSEVGKEILEQILAVDDFVSFKQMMVKRNMELELESLKELQVLSDKLEDGVDLPHTEDDDFEAELQAALELSVKEAKAAGISTDVDMAEIHRQQEEAEEADLRMALALSMQMEEHAIAQEELAANPAPPPAKPTPAPAPAPAPAPPPARAAPAPPAAMAPIKAPLGSLAPLPRITQFENPSATQVLAQEKAMQAQAQAAAVREAALAAKEERIEAAAPSQGAHGASAAEVRARAEHLKKQRDLILAKRKKEREAALPLAQQQQPPPQAAEPAPPAVSGHRAAGYSSQPVAPVAAERAALSRNLAFAMKSSLLGEDSATLDLQYRIDSHQRKVDLELTKQQLRDEGRPEF